MKSSDVDQDDGDTHGETITAIKVQTFSLIVIPILLSGPELIAIFLICLRGRAFRWTDSYELSRSQTNWTKIIVKGSIFDSKQGANKKELEETDNTETNSIEYDFVSVIGPNSSFDQHVEYIDTSIQQFSNGEEKKRTQNMQFSILEPSLHYLPSIFFRTTFRCSSPLSFQQHFYHTLIDLYVSDQVMFIYLSFVWTWRSPLASLWKFHSPI